MNRLSRRGALAVTTAAAGTSAAIIGRARAADPVDVVVIGAGLSGLNAALLIKDQGFKVTVVEGRKRVGGRMNTLRTVEGNPEMGGDSILGGYGRMQDIARRLNVELVNHEGRRDLSPDAQKDPTTVELALGGKVIKKADWPTHPLNVMPEGGKDRFPGARFFRRRSTSIIRSRLSKIGSSPRARSSTARRMTSSKSSAGPTRRSTSITIPMFSTAPRPTIPRS